MILIYGIVNFVYVDESGLNREYRRLYARAKRGVKVYDKKPGKRVKKVNIIAGLLYGVSGKKHIAVHSYEHSTKAAFFEDWFEWLLLAEVPENSVIILDNASFHRKKILSEIAARYGVVVLFLPPYCRNLIRLSIHGQISSTGSNIIPRVFQCLKSLLITISMNTVINSADYNL